MRRLVGLLLLGAPGCIPHDVRTTYDEELDSSEPEEADSSEPQSRNTAQSWPRPTPVAARQDAEKGKVVVKLELPLGNKSMLKLWASPEQGGETVELMLIRAEDEPGLTSCGLEVMVNGERLATPAAKALRKGRVSALASKIGAELSSCGSWAQPGKWPSVRARTAGRWTARSSSKFTGSSRSTKRSSPGSAVRKKARPAGCSHLPAAGRSGPPRARRLSRQAVEHSMHRRSSSVWHPRCCWWRLSVGA